MAKKTTTAPDYNSIKVSAAVYEEINALRTLLTAKGLDTLPKDLRPAASTRFGMGETINVALRALRKTLKNK